MQAVDKISFWKERIQEAKKNNKLHYSVYIAHDRLWQKVCKTHEEIIKKEIKEGEKVLDVGCGYGRLSPMFSNYVGVDFSPDFIQEAKSLYPDKKFIVANLKDLPFEDKEFDVGIAVSIRGMIVGNLGKPEWTKMEKELKRVCKKVLVMEYGVYESGRDTVDTISEYEIL